MISLRACLSEHSTTASPGLRLIGDLAHDFYKDVPEAFPYRSLRNIIHAMHWPSKRSYVFLEDYPDNTEPDWAWTVQGIASDATHFYISQSHSDEIDAVWKVPHQFINDEDNLENNKVHRVVNPARHNEKTSDNEKGKYHHFGALALQDGLLYVPVEGPMAVFVFSASGRLAFLGRHDLDASQHEAGWCAVNPKQPDLLFTSPFYNIEDTKTQRKIFIYRKAFDKTTNNLSLNFLGAIPLLDTNGKAIGNKLSRIQGGDFSKNGHLYLVCDYKEGGLMGFDMISGRLRMHLPVDYESDPILSIAGSGKEELEGVMCFPMDGTVHPSLKGEIHICMARNLNFLPGTDTKDFHLKHIDISGLDKEFI